MAEQVFYDSNFVKGSLNRLRDPKVYVPLIATLAMLSMAACGNNEESSPKPNVAATTDTNPQPAETQQVVAEVTSEKIDTSITGVKSDEEAAEMLLKWSKGLSKSNYYRPELLIDASGVNGAASQQSAIDIMANELFITPKEIALWTEINLEQIKQVKVFAPELISEDKYSTNEFHNSAQWTGLTQYDATRAWAQITGSINNQIANGTIIYPSTDNSCDFDESYKPNMYQTSYGQIAQSVLAPSIGNFNTVSYELYNCPEQSELISAYKESTKFLYQANIDFDQEYYFPYEAKAMKIFSSPILGGNKQVSNLVAEIKNS